MVYGLTMINRHKYWPSPKAEIDVRHVCGSWITSSGDSQQWYCAECGRSANDISWIIPAEVNGGTEEVKDEP